MAVRLRRIPRWRRLPRLARLWWREYALLRRAGNGRLAAARAAQRSWWLLLRWPA
jgi:hypothetical protein